MTTFDRFERDLPGLLEELYVGSIPSYRDDILDRTTAMRQRPGWTFIERWLPMSAITERLAAAPRVPWRVVAVAALLILALVAAALYAGSQQRRLPEPFGPAGNGLIAYADAAGDIFVGNPVTGAAKAIVTGPDYDTRPVFSPDGSTVAFLRGPTGVNDIVVADADGSRLHVITTEKVLSHQRYGVSYFAWTPDSKAVVVGNPTEKLLAYDADKAAEPRELVDVGLQSEMLHPQTATLFRPPAGDEIAYVGSLGGSPTLNVVSSVGASSRVLVDSSTPVIGGHEISSPVWSPDGSMIAFTVGIDPSINDYRVFVMNADGSGIRPLRGQIPLGSMGCASPCAVVSEANPAWSPDGSKIAVMRWFDKANGDWLSSRPITVVDVVSGASTEIDFSSEDGYIGWGWSPDGKSILALPIADQTYEGGTGSTPGTMLIADATTGAVRQIEWDASAAPSWQRLAP